MEIVRPGDPGYPKARIISNARFDYEPAAIYFCDRIEDVQTAVGVAPGKMRVRSGGHHHEGMCSGKDVTIVDITRFSSYVKFEGEIVKIGAGTRLKDVYDAVGEAKRLFPGGGCGDVRTGGLVQGGGWGPYSRKLGLTCDSLDGFTMIKADGKCLNVTRGDANHRLFWAVSGGGGGNFGVITEYRFRLQSYEGFITQFTVTWKERSIVRSVINEWRKNFPGDSDVRLTSFCRLGTGDDAPALVGGAFLGDPDVCAGVLRRLLPATFDSGVMTYQAGVGARGSQHPDYQPGPPSPAPGDSPNLGDTCAGNPFPHKVSSCFPAADFENGGVDIILDWLSRAKTLDNARRYLSLHCLGGAVGDLAREQTSCFAFRSKPFMLQYQAWWWDMTKPDITEACMDWVAGFRDAMRPRHTQGSFINFPDYDLVKPEVPDHRKKLLSHYYDCNLNKLISVKHEYDRTNVFDFPMGIPPV